jgi:hypothetical protein
MTKVFVDIETIPTSSPAEMARIFDDVQSHNATLKKPHGDAEVRAIGDEAHRKTALDAASGELVVIGAAVNDGPPQSWSRDWREPGSERDLLVRFRDDMVDALDGAGASMIGHNAISFDRVFLRQRSLVLGVPLPGWMTAAIKPWEATEIDTMAMWTGGTPGKMIGLDRLARALGLPGKEGDISGAKVWDAILAGRLDDVARYCEADVTLTRDCWRRMRAVTSQAVAS